MQAIIVEQERKVLEQAYMILEELYKSAQRLDEEDKERAIPSHLLRKNDFLLDFKYETLENFIKEFSIVVKER